ncbi:proteasome subunit beta type-11-like, partial [Anguilla anguilla]|uniref:proteasome subunit beta type-11-like n=1 Tax=Anguilla anguilla TaxID=7936 RepID=UPI0015B0E11E
MALQEVCGFRDSPVYPRWNTPASLSMATSDNILHSTVWEALEGPSTARGRDGEGPLSLYIPDPEHLSQNPLQAVAPPFELCHGTTTLAFAFQGGVIAAGDTRASCRGLVCSPDSLKVLPVHRRLLMTTSGSAADCILWKCILSRELRLYQLRHRRQLSVGGAAKLLSHMLHPFKGTNVCVAAMLCGWEGEEDRREWETDVVKDDPFGTSSRSEVPAGGAGGAGEGKTEGETRAPGAEGEGETVLEGPGCAVRSPGPSGPTGPRLYYVCSDGTRLQGELFSVGSGSPYAYSVLDGGVRWGMGVAEACRLAREAVYRAAHRDAYSGNCVDLYHVTATGWRRRDREDLKEEYYREMEGEREKVEERRRERER